MDTARAIPTQLMASCLTHAFGESPHRCQPPWQRRTLTYPFSSCRAVACHSANSIQEHTRTTHNHHATSSHCTHLSNHSPGPGAHPPYAPFHTSSSHTDSPRKSALLLSPPPPTSRQARSPGLGCAELHLRCAPPETASSLCLRIGQLAHARRGRAGQGWERMIRIHLPKAAVWLW